MIETFYNFDSVEVSIRLIFSSVRDRDDIFGVVDEAEASLRVPAYSIAQVPSHVVAGTVVINVRFETQMAHVSFAGDIGTPAFTTEVRRLPWDFWKIVGTMLGRHLLRSGVVVFHSACLGTPTRTVMLVGASGTGKSCVSYFAGTTGARVHASECCYVTEGYVVAGNHTLEVSTEALERFELPRSVEDSSSARASVLIRTEGVPHPERVTEIVFPRVSLGPMHRKTLGPERTRTLLYENAVGQTAVTALIARESIPLSVVPTRDELETIAEEVGVLSLLPSSIIEGSPEALWEAVVNDVGA
jgi:hypothetical protein